MATPSTVAAYLKAQPPATRRLLQQARAAIRAALPGAEEVISYQIPGYRLGGRNVIFLAAWKRHYALYPLSEGSLSAFEKELARFTVKGRTLQLPLDAPVPVKLIGRLAKFRAREVLKRAKPASRKGPRGET